MGPLDLQSSLLSPPNAGYSGRGENTAERMCAYGGQGPAISPYRWIPEKAELRGGQGLMGLSPSLQQPQGQCCSGLSFLARRDR